MIALTDLEARTAAKINMPYFKLLRSVGAFAERDRVAFGEQLRSATLGEMTVYTAEL